MSKKLIPLIPPDLKRCQAERLEGSFMTFGPRQLVRCERTPKWVVKEKKPGEDGRRGSMSLCAECAEIMEFKYGKDFATFKAIEKKEKHAQKKKVRKVRKVHSNR